MVAYADVTYYRDSFLGFLIPEGQFPTYAARASEYLDSLTFGAIPADVPDAVRMACCAVAEEGYRLELGRVASERAGDYTVTYETGGRAGKERLHEAALMYLADTGLVFRGVRP